MASFHLRHLPVFLLIAGWLPISAAQAATPTHADIAYGPDPATQLDIYLPARAAQQPSTPAIVMVHGGGWRRGSKSAASVVDNKADHWLPRGVALISIDYRLLPTDPLQQTADVAAALAFIQHNAAQWKIDPQRLVLMGHSAGAHLVALLSAKVATMGDSELQPWLGTLALDSAAFDVPAIMQSRHLRLYDNAFGKDPAFWQAVSPLHQLTQGMPPLLAVCSSKRDTPCPQARAFASKARELGRRVEVIPLDMTHREINSALGFDPAYTAQVDKFLASLDPAFAAPRGTQ
ncbi:Acetyl esterase/lipase [Halopseudomonas sabulinigri]|uniref:Acetyl esterase/lipase n=1 Tax=Halopseudomonas sabulinigri TaxID=472181 RepID=A0A1H1S5T6_9GAMM|nr:alpha/beta hydrolase [Halopseudomonas sabulinigri]SDS43331.1 Acetyl esterase/lipase [Halopseudomonas sabulinigri]